MLVICICINHYSVSNKYRIHRNNLSLGVVKDGLLII
jgi:hypothetical protein